jgi:putative endonuclease
VKRNVMYIGVTNDLGRRISEHRNEEGSSFTRRYKVSTLVYAEEYQDVEEAIAREEQIKGWRRSKKDALIEAANPSWADLLLDVASVKGPSLRSG